MKSFLALLLFPLLAFSYPMTPDKNKNPGDLCTDNDEDFYEYRYDERIPYCERNVSALTKRKIYDAYRVPENERREYTIDHILPLAIGGSNHWKNLWPEHKEVKALRPTLEDKLYRAMRDGEMEQSEAVRTVLRAKFNPRNNAWLLMGATPSDSCEYAP